MSGERRGIRSARRDRHGRDTPAAPSADLPMKRFIENVPAREFQEALEAATDPKFEMLCALMVDPAHAGTSFALLCRKAQLTLNDVNDLWRNHQLHLGMMELMVHVPQVLRDVVEDAKSHDTACPRCDGLGKVVDMMGEVTIERTCPLCKGSTVQRVVGDKAARDLVFESIGLTGKRGPMVAIQQNFGLDADLGEALMASQKVISGETL